MTARMTYPTREAAFKSAAKFGWSRVDDTTIGFRFLRNVLVEVPGGYAWKMDEDVHGFVPPSFVEPC